MSSDVCPICHVPIPSDALFTTVCDHQFCAECAGKWAEKSTTCPMCRKVVFSQPAVRIEIHSISHTGVPVSPPPERNWSWSREAAGVSLMIGLILVYCNY